MKDLLLIPNILTSLRILLIFPSIYTLYTKQIWLATILITIVFITDFFDGYLARKLNQTSFLGAILDPVADKFVVLSFYTYLFWGEDKVPLIYYSLILTRDIAQLSSIPVLLFWKKIRFQVKPKLIPKWGTALNFIILAIIALQYFWQNISTFVVYIWGLNLILIISGMIEIYILVTFVPRFYEIYTGKHDTFE